MNYRYRSAEPSALSVHCTAWRRLLSLCVLLLGHGLQAAEPVGMLDLREAIAATLDANPQLGVYRFREEALAGERVTAGLRPPLQVNVGVEDALGSGAVKRFERAEFNLSFSQVIELGEQRDARVGITNQRQDLLRAERRVTEIDLYAETARRFIATVAAQQRLTLQVRATALAQQTLDALRPLVSAGQAPASEQARATAALERSRLAEAHARTALEVARLNLAGMWNRTAVTFEGVEADLLQTGEAGVLSGLLLGLEDNPDILLFATEERLRDAELREAASAQRGTLQWTAGIRNLRDSGDTGFVFSVSMPLGSRERAAGAMAAAEANLGEVSGRREIALNRMRTQLNALHLQLAQAILEVNTLRASVLPALLEAQEQTRAAYLGGRYGYLELVAAQAEYLNAELALIEAATDAHLLRTEIERLGGAPLNPANREIAP